MTYTFHGISRIDAVPAIDLLYAVPISGACVITDSRGNLVTVEFYEATYNYEGNLYVHAPSPTRDGEFDAVDLEWDDHDEYVVAPGLRLRAEDFELFKSALCNAIYDIDVKASQAAEDTWGEVWDDARRNAAASTAYRR